ncbi:LytR family transcriptional regulator [Enterococcus gilvus]|jgi:polyisoprenyl-teichoic acid--peptidoglycan teichoic acid transferase|uniref:LCP family protein n=1 Tax=Enterococcus gilvus TaxID=160453 RepID=UPI000DF636DD|nr:LCP family protein [Enterococcus gilvus]AXG37859.1 LytR family transcriptional regulator [Enterococcus gilvus]
MKVFKRVLLGVLGVLLIFECYLIFSFVQGYESTKHHQTKDNIHFNGEEAPDQNDLNILIIGTDSRGEDRGRSDSLMIAHYDQKKQQPKLVSIMRDSYVDIPGHGKDKINAAYSYGGIELVRKTLKENFDMPIEYYVTIDFDHFKEAIDSLFPKGVTIDAEKDLDLDQVFIKAGKQKMDGNTLLQYSRFREDEESDFGRIRRQQQVISAISQQVTDVTSLSKLPKTTGKLLGYVDTNLPESTILSVGKDFALGNTEKVETLAVPIDKSWEFNNDTPSGSVLELDTEANAKAIKKFLTE